MQASCACNDCVICSECSQDEPMPQAQLLDMSDDDTTESRADREHRAPHAHNQLTSTHA